MSPQPAAVTPLGAAAGCADETPPRFLFVRRVLFVLAGLAGIWILSLLMHPSSASAEVAPPSSASAPSVVESVLAPVAAPVAPVLTPVLAPVTPVVASLGAPVTAQVVQMTHQLATETAPIPVVGQIVATLVPTVDAALDATTPLALLPSPVADATHSAGLSAPSAFTTDFAAITGSPLSRSTVPAASTAAPMTSIASPSGPVAPSAPAPLPMSPPAPATAASVSVELNAIPASDALVRPSNSLARSVSDVPVVLALVIDDPSFSPD